MLAVDASASVNYDEFDLMTFGTAAALRDPAVGDAVAHTPGGVAFCLVQWSSIARQAVTLPWTLATDAAGTAQVGDLIARMPRTIDGGGTMIHAGLDYAAARFATAPGVARRRVIDISGNGRADDATALAATRARLARNGMVINGLAVEEDDAHLTTYFREAVIAGPGAFALHAADWETFGAAMRLKLLREIAGTIGM